MALAVTLSGDWLQNIGSQMSVTGTLAFDDNYPTGGESLTPAMIGLGAIDKIDIEPKAGYTFAYDYSAQKVLVYVAPAQTHTHDMTVIGGQGAAGTDTVTAPAGTDILGKQEAGNAVVLGADVATKGGVNSATLAAAALSQVANGTNLATLTGVKFRAVGR